MSKKYVIYLPDDAQYILINGASENHCYTRVEQVDDLEELNSDYINEHFGGLQDEAYQRGLDDAMSAFKKLYSCGWERDWKAMGFEFNEGEWSTSFEYIIGQYTASEIVEKVKAYEDKPSDRIEVGDEVRTRDGAPSHTFLVTKVTDSHVYGISNDGSWNYYTKDSVTKTGKHYDIASILEAMRTHD